MPLNSSLTRDISHAEAVNGSSGSTNGVGASNGHHVGGGSHHERRGMDPITQSKARPVFSVAQPDINAVLSAGLMNY